MNKNVKYPCTYDALPSLIRYSQQKKARFNANVSWAVWLFALTLIIALI